MIITIGETRSLCLYKLIAVHIAHYYSAPIFILECTSAIPIWLPLFPPRTGNCITPPCKILRGLIILTANRTVYR